MLIEFEYVVSDSAGVLGITTDAVYFNIMIG